MYFDSITQFISSFTSIVPTVGEYTVAGYDFPDDGGGGSFIWVPITQQTPLLNGDEGIVFRTPAQSPGENLGYFKRIYSGPVNVRWFGAKGDGVTDDTAAVHAAAKAAQYGT